ncbi:Ndc1p NDAI_0C00810 [Naumovozyma dairenensis CBS 421]|uniref:Nucleoporin NDC1 n=1 Tax=Naumovozyma dairenensis (strain ATCC 10597 / BCRC 20456 / CBS 421 / NBRC 0211 / NRRL Y-12639) TaxID=1071378 RepID=G0W7I1_NAUDC|nr:hypothetical protein NDAI_0C00810 [Naumovozyma dairenensis CBS 421]CCD23742.1 hypothetical protein NDAI_0C00810 [Naumovozyma dairenensis CBS 421]
MAKANLHSTLFKLWRSVKLFMFLLTFAIRIIEEFYFPCNSSFMKKTLMISSHSLRRHYKGELLQLLDINLDIQYERTGEVLIIMQRQKPLLSNTRYSYHAIFSDICKTRFSHLVTRLFFVTTLLQTLLITILSSPQSFAWERVLLFFPRFLFIYIVSISIIITRKNYLHVESIGYSNWYTTIFGQLCSTRFVVYQFIYCVGTFAIALALGDCFQISSLSRNSASLHKLYVWLLIPTLYNLQHNIFDQDKISFPFESQIQLPQQYISRSLRHLVIKSLIMTITLPIMVPILSLILPFNIVPRGLILIGFISNLKLAILSFWIFMNFEFINVAFSAHMSIGCLHKGKPISSLSPNSMEILLDGLSSKRAFTKLTAFQELAYRATSSDSSLRLPLYKPNFKDSNLWPLILRECLLVIQNTNESVTGYLRNIEIQSSVNQPKTMLATSNSNLGDKSLFDRQRQEEIIRNEMIFGNAPSPNMLKYESLQNVPMPLPSRMATTSSRHRMPLRDENVLLTPPPAHGSRGRRFQPSSSPSIYQRSPSNVPTHPFNEPILTHSTGLTRFFHFIVNTIKSSLSSFFFPSITPSSSSSSNAEKTIPHLSFFSMFCTSKKNEADKLVPLPICHAESVISLMALLINSLDESPRGPVIASVGDVLRSLQLSINCLGKFTEWEPSPFKDVTAIYSEGEEQEQKIKEEVDVISVLYNLSISAFLEIVLKYDDLLKDVNLDEDVVKLTRWVLEMCNNSTFLAPSNEEL